MFTLAPACPTQPGHPIPPRRRAGGGSPLPTRQQRGFTLIELMVAISVLVILSTIGVPNLIGVVHGARVAVLANDLTLALSLARAEAVRRGEDVALCASADGQRCGGDWSQGWILIRMRDGAPVGSPVQVWQPHWQDLGPALDAEDGPRTIVFDNLGASRTGAVSFTIGVKPDTSLRARQIELTAAGRTALTDYVAGGS